VLANPHIETRFNTVVAEIRGDKKVGSVVLERVDTKERAEEAAEAVFVFVGSIPQTALAPAEVKDEAGSIRTDERMATSVPGLFAAGDVREKAVRQITTAVADGTIAALNAEKSIKQR